MQVLLENVRTFDGRHQFPFKPLTILTGENSAGKSTLLGMVAGIFQSSNFPFVPDFDQSPYHLGSYDSIATFKGGSYGRAKCFRVGFVVGKDEEESVWGLDREVIATYVSDRGRVSLDQLEATSRSLKMVLEVTKRSGRTSRCRTQFQHNNKPVLSDLEFSYSIDDPLISLGRLISTAVFEARADRPRMNERLWDRLLHLAFFLGRGAVTSVAPIRTRPRRLYMKAKEAFEPEGDHIPFVLDRILFDPESRKERVELEQALNRFGSLSGLFRGVSIKKRGKKATDPFEVMVKLAGRARNLIDVGYGVSQALPVVVQTVLENPGNMVLLQQPEVHLHPKAQAALGSFFAEMAGAGRRTLVLETHSDFIVDRIRQEVANGTIPPESVQILFLHRDRYESTVHALSLDKKGNVQNAPPIYREFFLREELSLLRRAQM